jgi:hypothetical protein
LKEAEEDNQNKTRTRRRPTEETMGYGFLADAILAVHILLVGYVFFGQLLIWWGLLLGSSWVRNPWFRWTHLILIALVGVEALLNIECPLTRWERQFRELAGQTVNGEAFLGRLLHHLIYVDCPLSALNGMQFCFALLALATFVLAPPRQHIVVQAAAHKQRHS